MSYWKCTNTLRMEVTEEVAFTKGKVYYGYTSATSGGEWAMAFTDDTGFDNHLITSKWLHEHFVKVEKAERDEEEEPPPGASLCLDRDYMLAREGDEPYEPDYWGAYYI